MINTENGECKTCGKCRFSMFDPVQKDFICANEDGDNYGLTTMYDDGCEDWESKNQEDMDE